MTEKQEMYRSSIIIDENLMHVLTKCMFLYREHNCPDTIFFSEYYVTGAIESDQEHPKKFWLPENKRTHVKWLLSLAKPALLNSTCTNFQFVEESLLYCGAVRKF